MTDDIEARLDEFEETLERQQETIERQEATIERQRERIADLEPDGMSDGSVGMSRRRVMQAGGALGLLGLGVGTASADPAGQVGTSEDPLNALYTESLQGGIVPGGEIENLVGDGLGIYPPTNTLEVDWGDAGDLDETGNVEWGSAEDLDETGNVEWGSAGNLDGGGNVEWGSAGNLDGGGNVEWGSADDLDETGNVEWGSADDLDETGNVEWGNAEDLDDNGAVTDDGDWTETDDGDFLEPTNTSVNGVSLWESNSGGGKTTINTNGRGQFLHFDLGVDGGGLLLQDIGIATGVRILNGLTEESTDNTLGPVHIKGNGALVVGTEQP